MLLSLSLALAFLQATLAKHSQKSYLPNIGDPCRLTGTTVPTWCNTDISKVVACKGTPPTWMEIMDCAPLGQVCKETGGGGPFACQN